MEYETRAMRVKILYAIEPVGVSSIAQIWPVPVTVIPPPEDCPHPLGYGKVLLKHCLFQLCQTVPELVPEPGMDFSVYAQDPLEPAHEPMSLPSHTAASSTVRDGQPNGPAIGLGPVSWCLSDNVDDEDAPFVVGTLFSHMAMGTMLTITLMFKQIPFRTRDEQESLIKLWSSPAVVPQPPGPVGQAYSGWAIVPLDVMESSPALAYAQPAPSRPKDTKSKTTTVLPTSVNSNTKSSGSARPASKPNAKPAERAKQPPAPPAAIQMPQMHPHLTPYYAFPPPGSQTPSMPLQPPPGWQPPPPGAVWAVPPGMSPGDFALMVLRDVYSDPNGGQEKLQRTLNSLAHFLGPSQPPLPTPTAVARPRPRPTGAAPPSSPLMSNRPAPPRGAPPKSKLPVSSSPAPRAATTAPLKFLSASRPGSAPRAGSGPVSAHAQAATASSPALPTVAMHHSAPSPVLNVKNVLPRPAHAVVIAGLGPTSSPAAAAAAKVLPGAAVKENLPPASRSRGTKRPAETEAGGAKKKPSPRGAGTFGTDSSNTHQAPVFARPATPPRRDTIGIPPSSSPLFSQGRSQRSSDPASSTPRAFANLPMTSSPPRMSSPTPFARRPGPAPTPYRPSQLPPSSPPPPTSDAEEDLSSATTTPTSISEEEAEMAADPDADMPDGEGQSDADLHDELFGDWEDALAV